MPHDPAAITFTHDGESFTLFASVHGMKHRQEPDVFGGTREGLYARLETRGTPGANPAILYMSRLLGEHRWYIDGEFAANGFPHHNNGFGVRYLRVDTVVDELNALLNERAAELGLTTGTDASAPLRLAVKGIPPNAPAVAPPQSNTSAARNR
jgi:hypothetical protein